MTLYELIEDAAAIVGTQRKLADMLEIRYQHLSEMKLGKRACSMELRAQMAHIAGHDVMTTLLDGVALEMRVSKDPLVRDAGEQLYSIASFVRTSNDWRKR